MNMNLYDNNCRNTIFRDNRFLISKVGIDANDAKRLNVNCNCYGRIRYFKMDKYEDWIKNPLPMAPFAHALGLDVKKEIPVQVFQVAKCNMNCWWCFLPDKYKIASQQYSKWFYVDELIKMFIEDNNEARVIDLSGGNPELVPEWVLGFMRHLEAIGRAEDIYLWSDDVLTTDCFFSKLSIEEQQYMAQYKMYGKVACFKGFDEESFTFNTCSINHSLKDQMFLAKKYIEAGFDIYFYQVLTCLNIENIEKKIANYMDQLQGISHDVPLRVVPIKIKKFGANEKRFIGEKVPSIDNQYVALEVWKNEIYKRYGMEMFDWNIEDVVL